MIIIGKVHLVLLGSSSIYHHRKCCHITSPNDTQFWYIFDSSFCPHSTNSLEVTDYSRKAGPLSGTQWNPLRQGSLSLRGLRMIAASRSTQTSVTLTNSFFTMIVFRERLSFENPCLLLFLYQPVPPLAWGVCFVSNLTSNFTTPHSPGQMA